MRRKILQDLANTVCQMVVGWRVGEDVDRIASLPDGTLSFDLLNGTADHSSGTKPELRIAGALEAWLKSRLVSENIDPSQLIAATLTVQHKTGRNKSSRKRALSFFECQSLLVTDERRYEGKNLNK